MPRNSSGVYSLPSSNPVVPDTLIETAWANPTMSDLGAEITNSLDRQGRGTMLAPLKIFDGTVITPGLSFNAESSTGMYRPASHVLGFAVAGIAMALFSDTDATFTKNVIAQQNVTVTGTTTLNGPITMAGVLSLPLGTALLPSLSFTGDPNTGMYSPGADTIGWSTNGLVRMSLDQTKLTMLNSSEVRVAQAGAIFSGYDNSNTTRSGYLQFNAAGVLGLVSEGAAGAISLVTNGGTRVGINAAGNVVVNLPASGVPLTINTSAAASALSITDGTVTSRWYSDASTGVFIGPTSNHAFTVQTNGNSRVAIGAAGNVLINPPSSGVAFAASVATAVAVMNLTNSVAANQSGQLTLFNNAGAILSHGVDGSTASAYGARGANVAYLYTNSAAGMVLMSESGPLQFTAGTNAVRMAISAAGNVGIAAPASGSTLAVDAPGVGNRAITLNQPTAAKQLLMEWQLQSVAKSFMGVVGAAGDLVTGSLVGDLVLRTETGGSTGIRFTADSGATATFRVDNFGPLAANSPATDDIGARMPNCDWVSRATVGGKQRTWQNMTGVGGRALAATIPSPAYPIEVNINFAFPATSGTVVTLTVGGIAVCTKSNGTAGAYTEMVSAVVPPNTNYVISNSVGTPTINTWAELR